MTSDQAALERGCQGARLSACCHRAAANSQPSQALGLPASPHWSAARVQSLPPDGDLFANARVGPFQHSHGWSNELCSPVCEGTSDVMFPENNIASKASRAEQQSNS